MSEKVRVYINSQPVDVDAQATALDAVSRWDAAEGAALRAGERLITDSRGIVTSNDAPVHNGAIFRIVRARQSPIDDDFTKT